MFRLVKVQGTNLYIIGEVVFVTGIYRHGFRGKLWLLRFSRLRCWLFRMRNIWFRLCLCPALRLRFLQKSGAQHGSGVRPQQSEGVYALFPMHLCLKAASRGDEICLGAVLQRHGVRVRRGENVGKIRTDGGVALALPEQLPHLVPDVRREDAVHQEVTEVVVSAPCGKEICYGGVPLIPSQQPFKILAAFGAEYGIAECWVTKLHIERADLRDLKGGVVQIDGIAHGIRRTENHVFLFVFGSDLLDRLRLLRSEEIAGVEVTLKNGAVYADRFLLRDAWQSVPNIIFVYTLDHHQSIPLFGCGGRKAVAHAIGIPQRRCENRHVRLHTAAALNTGEVVNGVRLLREAKHLPTLLIEAVKGRVPDAGNAALVGVQTDGKTVR